MCAPEINLCNVFIPPCLGPSGAGRLKMPASLAEGTVKLGAGGLVSMSLDMTQCHKNELSRRLAADG